MEITLETVVFFFLAAFIAVFSILTVTTSRIVRSATYLLFVLLATAGIYFLLGYSFLGAVQIMVYAGGIVVLYVFSILLTRGPGDKVTKVKPGKLLTSVVTCLVGAVMVLFVILKHKFLAQASVSSDELIDFQAIGQHMVSSDKFGYLLPFEAVSVLLLACMIGGLLIARKR